MRRKWTRKKLLLVGPLAIVGIAALIAVGGELVALLWNALLPPLFRWPQITFWQALGILLLSRVLFGGGPGAYRTGFRRRMADQMSDRMADRMAERWEHMTPEEREKFREGLRRCGFVPASGDKS